MPTAYEAFLLYQTLHLHFTHRPYDFFKYKGAHRFSVEKFERRGDRYFFHKLAHRYPLKDDLMFFLAANFFYRDATWVRDLLTEESHDIYLQKKKIKESLEYVVMQDLEILCSRSRNGSTFKSLLQTHGDSPPLLTMMAQKEIHAETIIVLDTIIGFLNTWEKNITDTILFPVVKLKCQRYAPFLEIDAKKFRHLIKLRLTCHK